MSNYLSSGIQGAGTGAAAGSAAGPWGALIGGVAGLGAGLFSAYESEEETKKKLAALERAEREYNRKMNEIAASISSYYNNPSNFVGKAEDVQNYRDLVSSYDPNAYVYDFGNFDYDKDVKDFVNPYYKDIIDATTKGVQETAAGSAMGRSTGAAQAIATAQARKEDELYKTALSEYNTDRARAYQEYSDNITRNQNRLNQIKAGKDSQIALAGNLANDYTQSRQQYQSDLTAQRLANANGSLNFAGLKVGI